MSAHSEMPGCDAADFISKMQALIEQHGVDSVLDALGDACGLLAGVASNDLIYAIGDHKSREGQMANLQALSFAWEKIVEASNAIAEHTPQYTVNRSKTTR